MKTPFRSSISLLLLAGAIFGGAGCRVVSDAPTDLSQPGWQVRETAAVWRPAAAAPELAGELLTARHSDGSLFVQFSKQGLPLVSARTTTNSWLITSALRSDRFSGFLRRSGPPDQVPWFLCATQPPTPRVGSRWRVETQPDGSWRLANPRTGEWLEGVP